MKCPAVRALFLLAVLLTGCAYQGNLPDHSNPPWPRPLEVAIPALNHSHPAQVLRVVDGDTVAVNINLGCGVVLHDQHIRFLGCNAPERFTSNGPIATAIVRSYLPTNKPVILEMPLEPDGSEKKEKYGRWLAVVNVGGTNLSTTLTTTHTNIFKP